MQINRKLTMKLIALIFVIVVAVALADDSTNNPWIKAKQECQEDPATRLDDESAENLRKSKKYSDNFGAHMLCISKKIGNQKADGEIDEVVLKSNLEKMLKDSEKANEIANRCVVKKESPERTAAHLHGCIRHSVPKLEHH